MSNLENCLVTGGAGFIGSHLVSKLLENGHKVIVIDNLVEGKLDNLPLYNSNLHFIQASIEDNLPDVCKDVDTMFHLAALPRVQRSIKYPRETHDVNVTGTLNLLLAAKDHGVKRFVLSSSSSVYGNQDQLPFVESMVPNPLSPYALHKLIDEQYCQLFSKIFGLGTICLRYFNVYGPRMNPDGAYANLFPKFIKLMSQNETPTINGDGEQTRDFTYVDDVVEANLLAAQSSISGEVFNVGNGKNVSVNEVVSILNRLMGKNIVPIYGPAVIEPKSTLASGIKSYEMLGWKPKVELEEGIKTML